MDTRTDESRRTVISTGELPSLAIAQFSRSHPFTVQLNILFPTSESGDLESALASLESLYAKGKSPLADIYEHAASHAGRSDNKSDFIALCNEYSDDTWCIDQRGLLTINACKETYERLGIVGNKLPFKGLPEQYAVRIAAEPSKVESPETAKAKLALKRFDERREATRGEWWPVVYTGDVSQTVLNTNHEIVAVKAKFRKSHSVVMPSTICICPPSGDKEGLEDWKEDTHALFEWIGMACLESQRLDVNDNVEPYVAVYEPPIPSHISRVSHFQWKGLLSPQFVQSIIDMAAETRSPWISITGHSAPISPVTYIPPSAFKTDAPYSAQSQSPPRMTGPHAENTWSLLMSSVEQSSTAATDMNAVMKWIKVEGTGWRA